MSNIYLLNYNNYYNRIVKKEDSLSGYLTHLVYGSSSIQPLTGMNFNPNDGVETEHIINWNYDVPDYLLVVENNIIISRWFVIEAVRTRGKQFRMSLRRDVIVDFYNKVIAAPCFIDKAKVNDNDIAIFNKEPYAFNKIKKSETLLKDDTDCAWIVGYCSYKDAGATVTQNKITGNIKFPIDPSMADYTVSSKAEYFNNFSTVLKTAVGDNYTVHGSMDSIYENIMCRDANWNIQLIAHGVNSYNYNSYYTYTTNTPNLNYSQLLKNGVAFTATENEINSIKNSFNRALNMSYNATTKYFDEIKNLYKTYTQCNTNEAINSIIEENGKIVKVGSTYYVVSVARKPKTQIVDNIGTSIANIYNVFESLRSQINTLTTPYSIAAGVNGYFYKLLLERYDYSFELIDVTSSLNMTFELPDTTTRQHLTDAPYDMFCMPYTNSKSFYNGNTFICQSNKFLNMAAAMSIIAELAGVGFVYDMQLLPYCPLSSNNIKSNGDIDTRNVTQGYIKSGSATLGVIMFCQQSQFEFSIANTINVTNTKVQHQTDNWRFNSPNWSSSYDFDVTMNRGLEYIDVDCNYKPYTPYIHLCPRFNSNGLYGYNNNDAVGLICSGDFSLPAVTDQWKTYEYQNKNYQNIFDRNIQNQNENYRLQQIQQGASAISGIFTGAAAGALAFGGLGGAIVGGLASAGGAVADAMVTKAQHKEAVSYATDTFNYQIDNIKSLPNTLTKVSAFNNNNRIFPFIEYFSCSDDEKAIFENMLNYQGMTVNRVDKIENFLTNDIQYIKGRIIRLESLEEDYHLATQIADEISKGVYI